MALIKNFILWEKILLRDQESRVINGGTTTKYFSLGKGKIEREKKLSDFNRYSTSIENVENEKPYTYTRRENRYL